VIPRRRLAPLLEVDDLSIRYGRVAALEHVSLAWQPRRGGAP